MSDIMMVYKRVGSSNAFRAKINPPSVSCLTHDAEGTLLGFQMVKPVTRKCVVCGKEFTPKKCSSASNVSCSIACNSKKWALANPEKIKLNNIKGRKSDAFKKWLIDNKDRNKDIARKKYRENPERNKEQARRWHKENKSRKQELAKQWILSHPEYNRMHSEKRRSLISKHSCTFTIAEWKQALTFFDNKCAYCGTSLTKANQDHFIPLSKGGSYTRDNIVPVCAHCNNKKHNTNPLDWLVMQTQGLVAYVKVMQYFEHDGGLNEKQKEQHQHRGK